LVGDGELRATVEDPVKTYNLEANVCVTGWLSNDDDRTYISAARSLILPSFAEGLPVVIMEAMALRRPITSTFVAGIPHLVGNGEDGRLIPSGDVEAIVDIMKTCLEASPETLKTMGDAAFEEVFKFHDVNQEACKAIRWFR
jgi:glycosyltransferase involved in cell wall biosynthesis